ncbi:hypothetical protein ACFUN8_18575 [Streptomyces sp. NPDC057307]|uniref:hypothetical protein n=1 Tax=Streptomyces sp. NPDC057307 TaxID=3346096 RepID=UPI003633B956
MSDTTTRLALYKPEPSEDVNVETDLNANLDALDLNMGFRICTSSTRPSVKWDGMAIRETDTGKCYVWFASSTTWTEVLLGGGSIDLPAGEQFNVGGTTSTASFAAINTAAATDLLTGRVTGDTQNRFLVETDGGLFWGAGGGSAPDVTLYRSAANTLRTADSFVVDLDVTVSGDLTVAGIGKDIFVTKSALTSRASNVTPANDTHLLASVAANATYLVTVILAWTNGGGGMRCDFAGPASATMVWNDNDGVGVGAIGTDVIFSATTGTTLNGTLVTSGTAGTLNFRWAQNTTNVANTTLLAGCSMYLRRVA